MLYEYVDDYRNKHILAKPVSSTGKYIISGSIVEEYIYANPQARHLLFDQTKSKGHGVRRTLTPEQEKDIQLRSAYRAKQQLRRLVDANFKEWKDPDGALYTQKFVTLTFKENLQDLEKANRYFTDFIKRLNWHVSHDHKNRLKYVAVHEIQKRGAIHYHSVFFNLPYIRNDRIARIWDHGYIKVNKISSIKNVGAYLAKYLTKDETTPRSKGQKRYFASRFLKLPLKIQEQDRVSKLGSILNDVKPDFEYQADQKSYVQYTYRTYDLSKRSPVKKLVLESLQGRY